MQFEQKMYMSCLPLASWTWVWLELDASIYLWQGSMVILIGQLGGVQVLRHQRGGWVGWPNDDVWWQGGWVGVAKWWRDQKINKEKKEPGSDTMPIISVKTYLKSIYPVEDITDQFNSSDWFFFWKNEPELLCSM